ncbi:helix-turn-helix domain-containing protein [Mycobacterium sp. 852002-40037_SCH5390672]|uniref:helix-turn-helix domain-containing protein n=1 Tax=Mycobacterium sp. 852002-40037_SCH5390672 TaxID=1834089 RepID=UPI0009EE81BA
MPTRHWVSLYDAADELGCSIRHLRRLISAGELRAYRIGTHRMIRIDRADLDKVIQPVVPNGPVPEYEIEERRDRFMRPSGEA